MISKFHLLVFAFSNFEVFAVKSQAEVKYAKAIESAREGFENSAQVSQHEKASAALEDAYSELKEIIAERNAPVGENKTTLG